MKHPSSIVPTRTSRRRAAAHVAAIASALGFAGAAAAGGCPPSDHACNVAGGPGCSDTTCCGEVCSVDPFCCEVAWDSACVNTAGFLCAFVHSCDAQGPCNDCATSSIIAFPGGAKEFDSTGASTDGPPNFNCSIGNDIWYLVQSISADPLEISVSSPSWDSAIGVYVIGVNPVFNPDELPFLYAGCVDALAAGGEAALIESPVPGHYYLVQVAGYDGGGGAASGAGTISISQALPSALASPGAPTCIGDLTGDGVVDGGDLGVLLGEWGTAGAAGADLTGDGIVDGADMGTMLAAWGPCPAPGYVDMAFEHVEVNLTSQLGRPVTAVIYGALLVNVAADDITGSVTVELSDGTVVTIEATPTAVLVTTGETVIDLMLDTPAAFKVNGSVVSSTTFFGIIEEDLAECAPLGEVKAVTKAFIGLVALASTPEFEQNVLAAQAEEEAGQNAMMGGKFKKFLCKVACGAGATIVMALKAAALAFVGGGCAPFIVIGGISLAFGLVKIAGIAIPCIQLIQFVLSGPGWSAAYNFLLGKWTG